AAFPPRQTDLHRRDLAQLEVPERQEALASAELLLRHAPELDEDAVVPLPVDLELLQPLGAKAVGEDLDGPVGRRRPVAGISGRIKELVADPSSPELVRAGTAGQADELLREKH